VALKFANAVNQDDAEFMEREYAVQSKLNHKNICKVMHDLTNPAQLTYPKEDGEGVAFAVEQLQKCTIYDFVALTGPFSKELTQYFMR